MNQTCWQFPKEGGCCPGMVVTSASAPRVLRYQELNIKREDNQCWLHGHLMCHPCGAKNKAAFLSYGKRVY